MLFLVSLLFFCSDPRQDLLALRFSRRMGKGENVDRSDTLTDKRRLFSQVVKSLKFAPETQMAGGTDKRKQSLYFPEEMLKEIQEEANRQDRSLSWVVQQAWKIARERIKSFPAVNDVTGEEAQTSRREE